MKRLYTLVFVTVFLASCLVAKNGFNCPTKNFIRNNSKQCLPELPRNPIGGAPFRGKRYPAYYQGYPYYGVYNYGSYRGQSYGI